MISHSVAFVHLCHYVYQFLCHVEQPSLLKRVSSFVDIHDKRAWNKFCTNFNTITSSFTVFSTTLVNCAGACALFGVS